MTSARDDPSIDLGLRRATAQEHLASWPSRDKILCELKPILAQHCPITEEKIKVALLLLKDLARFGGVCRANWLVATPLQQAQGGGANAHSLPPVDLLTGK